MKTETLLKLISFLSETLSKEDMRWLGQQLIDESERQSPLKAYTMEEIHQMIKAGEEDIAEGRYITNEELFDDLLNDSNYSRVV